MKFFKRLQGEYISNIRTGEAVLDETDIEITELEYNDILTAIRNKPEDTEEVVYRLNNDTLEYDACIPAPPEPPEPTSEELLSILLGGETE